MGKLFKKIFAVWFFVFALSVVCINVNNSNALSSVSRTYEGSQDFVLNEMPALSENSTDSNDLYIAFKEINEYRTEQGLNPLIWSEELTECAAIRAEESSRVWSHTRPDGTEWYTVDSNICYGENLAKGYESEDVVGAWKASPTHNENLLFAQYKYIGLAEYNGYIACEFCY